MFYTFISTYFELVFKYYQIVIFKGKSKPPFCDCTHYNDLAEVYQISQDS